MIYPNRKIHTLCAPILVAIMLGLASLAIAHPLPKGLGHNRVWVTKGAPPPPPASPMKVGFAGVRSLGAVSEGLIVGLFVGLIVSCILPTIWNILHSVLLQPCRRRCKSLMDCCSRRDQSDTARMARWGCRRHRPGSCRRRQTDDSDSEVSVASGASSSLVELMSPMSRLTSSSTAVVV